ncbi:hypothetical protein EV132_10857 [Rhizobium sullae]|uniref:Uncharacterized protein n=1 Tax=Rhizobium sullae TaxID=50338 RepID=A0A4R3Q213_RHISU|nr:hypothetical protein EV132_10857 [Rhizobium sullae]
MFDLEVVWQREVFSEIVSGKSSRIYLPNLTDV